MTLTLQEALHTSVDELRTRVGFDDASVMAFDPDALLPIAFATAWPRDVRASNAACRNEQIEADVHKFRDLAKAPVKAAALSDGDPLTAASPRWEQLLRPAGHRHELRAALTDGQGRCWGAVSLLRAGRRAFSEADLHAVSAWSSPAAGRLARSLVEGRAGTTAPVCSLWLDDDGNVLYATPDARRWLASDDAEPCPAGPPRISTAVAYRVLSAERAGATPHVVLRLRSRDGWLTVHGERIHDGDGAARGIALVVQPAHPAELLPLAEAAFGLSERETAVVRAVLQGADTRAVAKALHVTPYTVQDHLKSVFRKVGVNSRGALAEALTHPS